MKHFNQDTSYKQIKKEWRFYHEIPCKNQDTCNDVNQKYNDPRKVG